MLGRVAPDRWLDKNVGYPASGKEKHRISVKEITEHPAAGCLALLSGTTRNTCYYRSSRPWSTLTSSRTAWTSSRAPTTPSPSFSRETETWKRCMGQSPHRLDLCHISLKTFQIVIFFITSWIICQTPFQNWNNTFIATYLSFSFFIIWRHIKADILLNVLC